MMSCTHKTGAYHRRWGYGGALGQKNLFGILKINIIFCKKNKNKELQFNKIF